MILSEEQKNTILTVFDDSCDLWYEFIQDDTKREHLENNYKGRQNVGKMLRDYVGMNKSLKAYIEIRDELNKIEIKACQKYHNCMPPIRDLYPPSPELREWIEENYE